MFFHGLQNYFIEMFLSFIFFLPKIHVPANLTCEVQLFIRSPCFPACEIWDVGSQRERWWMLTGGWVSGPFPQCSLSRREHSQHSPTPSLLPHLTPKCPVPHTPTTLAPISSGPAHDLGDREVAELELQTFRNKGSEWCTTIWYGLRSHVGRLGWGNNSRETASQCQCLSGISSYSNLVKPQLLLLLKLKNKTTPPSPVS